MRVKDQKRAGIPNLSGGMSTPSESKDSERVSDVFDRLFRMLDYIDHKRNSK